MPNLNKILCRHLLFQLDRPTFYLLKSPPHFCPPINGALFFEQQNEHISIPCLMAQEIQICGGKHKIVNCDVIALIRWHFKVSKCSCGPIALENRKKSASLLVKILSKKPLISYKQTVHWP